MTKCLLSTLAGVMMVVQLALAQSAADVVVPIAISTTTNPPAITLSFPTRPTDTLTIIGRKLINQT